MSVDKLVDSTQLDSDLTSVANAIRTKGGTSGSLAFPAGFVSAIQNIPTGGGGTGLTLLNSGTYTLTTVKTPLVIPVSYSGTPVIVIVTAATRSSGVAQCMACVKIMKPSSVSSLWNNNGGVWLVGYSDSDAKSFTAPNATNIAKYTIDSSEISFPRQDSTRVWRAVDYNWYIYGETSSS